MWGQEQRLAVPSLLHPRAGVLGSRMVRAGPVLTTLPLPGMSVQTHLAEAASGS